MSDYSNFRMRRDVYGDSRMSLNGRLIAAVIVDVIACVNQYQAFGDLAER